MSRPLLLPFPTSESGLDPIRVEFVPPAAISEMSEFTVSAILKKKHFHRLVCADFDYIHDLPMNFAKLGSLLKCVISYKRKGSVNALEVLDHCKWPSRNPI